MYRDRIIMVVKCQVCFCIVFEKQKDSRMSESDTEERPVTELF
jgi:hypothetical protein